MRDRRVVWNGLVWLMGLVLLYGCGGTAGEPEASQAQDDMGTLQFRANGEDFVRQGFVTKDGWTLTFEHLYVTLDEVTAYQSDPPFDAEAGGEPQAVETVSLDQTYTVDLAAGDEQAAPVLIDERPAPAGRYNALAWKMVPAADGPAQGAVLMMQGSAEKDGTVLPFSIRLDQPSAQVCGDYVGDERKGMLEAGGTSDLEATFHFDHMFGDGEAAPDDAINTGALGFDPFAALAQDGVVDVDMDRLRAELTPEEYERLTDLHLTHVGEGHCHVVRED